jgi:5-methyltetrahydrofolate--homocysteine methyltransferase
MGNRFTELLAAKPYLLADGAMGTNLFGIGLPNGACPELWNVEQPDKVRSIHAAFIAAGSDIVLTNSFGGTRYRLKLHEAEGRVAELNRAAARIARSAADAAGRTVAVAGSMGPTGELFEPLGTLTHDAAKDASPSRPPPWPRAVPTCCGSRPCPRARRSPPPWPAPRPRGCPSSPP